MLTVPHGRYSTGLIFASAIKPDARVRHARLVGQPDRGLGRVHVRGHRLESGVLRQRLLQPLVRRHLQRRGLKARRHRRRRVVRLEPERRLPLGQQRPARILQVHDLVVEPLLLDLRPQHVLQRGLAHLVLRARQSLQLLQQAEVFAVDADLLLQEIEPVVSALHVVSALQRSRLEREVTALACRRRHRSGGPQLAHSRKAHHQPRHERSHHVLDVHLERELRVRQRALHRDALHRRHPVEVRRLHLRLVQQRVGQKVAQARIPRQHWQSWFSTLRAIRRGRGLNLPARFLFALGRNAFAPGQDQNRGPESAQRCRQAPWEGRGAGIHARLQALPMPRRWVVRIPSVERLPSTGVPERTATGAPGSCRPRQSAWEAHTPKNKADKHFFSIGLHYHRWTELQKPLMHTRTARVRNTDPTEKKSAAETAVPAEKRNGPGLENRLRAGGGKNRNKAGPGCGSKGGGDGASRLALLRRGQSRSSLQRHRFAGGLSPAATTALSASLFRATPARGPGSPARGGSPWTKLPPGQEPSQQHGHDGFHPSPLEPMSRTTWRSSPPRQSSSGTSRDPC